MGKDIMSQIDNAQAINGGGVSRGNTNVIASRIRYLAVGVLLSRLLDLDPTPDT